MLLVYIPLLLLSGGGKENSGSSTDGRVVPIVSCPSSEDDDDVTTGSHMTSRLPPLPRTVLGLRRPERVEERNIPDCEVEGKILSKKNTAYTFKLPKF